MIDVRRFPHEKVERATLAALTRSGADEPSAAAATRALMHASLLGVDSQGVRLTAHYCAAIEGGRVKGAPRLDYRRTAAATGMLDADDGLGHPAAYRGMQHACELAGESGLGAVAIVNSSHVGAAGAYALAGARAGCVALFVTNSDSGVNLHRGLAAFHGTNPIAAAAPVAGGRPWLLDMATSAVPFNRINLYRTLGLQLPPDSAVDAHGMPTTDAAQAAALVPLGGHGFGFKGAGLAGLVTILSAVLGGGTVDDLVAPMAGPDFATPRNLGQFCLAIDPERFAGAASFAETMARYLERLRDGPASAPPMAPGDREWAVEDDRLKSGIPLDPETAAFLGLTDGQAPG
jgi:LDH2 family malate/lactate/ureidoglycolate dehydrogenase